MGIALHLICETSDSTKSHFLFHLSSSLFFSKTWEGFWRMRRFSFFFFSFFAGKCSNPFFEIWASKCGCGEREWYEGFGEWSGEIKKELREGLFSRDFGDVWGRNNTWEKGQLYYSSKPTRFFFFFLLFILKIIPFFFFLS